MTKTHPDHPSSDEPKLKVPREEVPEPPAQRLSQLTASEAVTLEDAHVHEVYEEIAGHFSATRFKAWPKVAAFAEAIPKGSVVLDVGCGNGKNIPAAAGFVGCDRSHGLLQLAQAKGREALRCDGLSVPFRSHCADFVLSIAVIHHFATRERRLASIRELVRLTTPGGKILVYVWAKEQPKNRGGNDVFVNWSLKNQKGQLTDRTLQRYYHLFEQGELEALAKDAKCTVLESFYDQENWAVVLTPIAPA